MPFLLCWHLHWWCKATVNQTAGTWALIKVVAPDRTSCHCILHCHVLWREKNSFTVLLKNILDRAVQFLIFTNLDPRVPLFVGPWVMKWELHRKPYCWIRKDGCLQGRCTCDGRSWKMSYPLFHETLFFLERTTTNYDYSGLDIWQIFSPRKKWACHIKENHWSSLLPMVKFALSNFRKLISATVNVTASPNWKTFLIRSEVTLKKMQIFILYSEVC